MINRSLNSYWVKKAFETFYNVPFHGTRDAPNSSKELKAWAITNQLGVDSLPVFNGASDFTIFDAPMDNVVFRAWHDCIHLELDASFTLVDETRVFDKHIEQLRAINAPDSVINALYADGIAQVRYYYIHRQFVTNQARFINDCLVYGIDETLETNVIY